MPAKLVVPLWHKVCRNDGMRIGRRSSIQRTSTSTFSAMLPMAWTFLFLDLQEEPGAMEQLRSEHLSIFECLAVVAALVLQISSLITLLQEHIAH